MAYVEFTDRTGRLWRVWHTRPRHSEARSALPEDWRDGWLTFESGAEKRRLAPVPAGWEDLPPKRLELLCRVAEPAPLPPGTHDLVRREEKGPD
jgi:hypothetical protein